MDSLVIPWVLSGVSVAFLIGCVEYNRRTGFKKIRAMESPLDDALLWIDTTRASLSSIPASKLRDIAMAEASTQQLIRLYAAYHPAEPAKVTDPAAPAEVPADVVGEYALTTTR
ncbi:MAG TPA: hypothetical protein VEF06_15030 [Bryobacteraceae bacterium]|nr:hypothetical protein [Bryobacteraceae bacterium]